MFRARELGSLQVCVVWEEARLFKEDLLSDPGQAHQIADLWKSLCELEQGNKDGSRNEEEWKLIQK